MKNIVLRNGLVTKVDDDDFILISQYNWYAQKHHTGKRFYVRAWINGKIKPLHRFIMGEPIGLVVDHINGDSLDNCRSNLRICTHKQNAKNRKANDGRILPKGVYKSGNKFRADISVDGEKKFLGCFSSKEAASDAYNKAAMLLFGEYARSKE